jgi:hypothetical protein
MIKKSLASLFFSLLLASCARTEMPSSKPSSMPDSKPSSGNSVPYPASVVQNFMNACTKSNTSQAYCSCVIDKTQNRYSLEEYLLLEEKMSVDKNLPIEMLNFTLECKSSSSPENSTSSNNLPSPIEKPASSVDYYEKLKSYFPDEGKKRVYQVSSGKTDGGIDVNFYVVIDRDTIPYTAAVSVLAHRQDTDRCEVFTSFELIEDAKRVYSVMDKKATPEELSNRAEMVYQGLNESGVILANSTLLSCEKFPVLLQDYDLRQ